MDHWRRGWLRDEWINQTGNSPPSRPNAALRKTACGFPQELRHSAASASSTMVTEVLHSAHNVTRGKLDEAARQTRKDLGVSIEVVNSQIPRSTPSVRAN